MIPAILFDLDGTLIDSVDAHARAWQAAFEGFGHKIAYRRLRSQIGKGADTLLPTFLSEKERRRSGDAINGVRGEIFRHRYREKMRPFGGVRRLMQALRKRGFRIALASSAERSDVDHYLQVLRIKSLIDVATSADDAKRSKPHADIFVAARRRLKSLRPSQCVVIGDSPFDAIAAQRAGMRSIGFRSGGFGAPKLLAAGFEELYRNPNELFRRLEESRVLREVSAPSRRKASGPTNGSKAAGRSSE